MSIAAATASSPNIIAAPAAHSTPVYGFSFSELTSEMLALSGLGTIFESMSHIVSGVSLSLSGELPLSGVSFSLSGVSCSSSGMPPSGTSALSTGGFVVSVLLVLLLIGAVSSGTVVASEVVFDVGFRVVAEVLSLSLVSEPADEAVVFDITGGVFPVLAEGVVVVETVVLSELETEEAVVVVVVVAEGEVLDAVACTGSFGTVSVVFPPSNVTVPFPTESNVTVAV